MAKYSKKIIERIQAVSDDSLQDIADNTGVKRESLSAIINERNKEMNFADALILLRYLRNLNMAEYRDIFYNDFLAKIKLPTRN